MKVKTYIIEGNKLIAEYLGWKQAGNRFEKNWVKGECQRGLSLLATEFNYHENWSMLMPVVEKISRHKYLHWEGGCEPYENQAWPRTFGMLSAEGKPIVRFNACHSFTADTLLEAAWLAVVDFIKGINDPA